MRSSPMMPAIYRNVRCPVIPAAALAAAVLVLPACEAAQDSRTSQPPRPGFVAVRAPVDAGAIIDAAPDAAPPELAEVEDPKPWVFRALGVGMIVYPKRETSTLRRNGERASLRVVVDRAPNRWSTDRVETWSLAHSDTFVGTWHRDRQRTVFELASATGAQLRLTCRPARLTVHRAGAELIRTPHFQGECGDTGVWRPAATQVVTVLSCAASDPGLDPEQRQARAVDQVGQFGGTTVELSPAPGVESLYVNNDCLLQGGGYRLRAATD